MKLSLLSASLLSLAPALVLPAHAAITIPGADGSDGALNITQDTVIDLSKATTGKWDDNNSANAGNGVYDPEKWAVVFKYTSVNVLAGKKLTFKNHATRAPVVWLVSGNVTIGGTVDLSGESWNAPGVSAGRLPDAGPGGFRGGAARIAGDVLWASGFGPGGGQPSNDYREPLPLPASYGTAGGSASKTYGNPSLIPLVGGSGGSGNGGPNSGNESNAGGAGGGAILIAASGEIALANGSSLLSHGGTGIAAQWSTSGSGSGGGIRLISTRLTGGGSVSAAGGGGVAIGGSGRVRIERVSTTATLNVSPAPSVIDLLDGSAAVIWPPTGAPEAKIILVNQVAVTTDPTASFGAYTPDVALPLVSSVSIVVETVNVEQASKVVVRLTPRNGMTVSGARKTNAAEVNATIKEVLSETPLKLRWEATVPTLPGYSAIQARIVRP
jgi:hypothetical protein